MGEGGRSRPSPPRCPALLGRTPAEHGQPSTRALGQASPRDPASCLGRGSREETSLARAGGQECGLLTSHCPSSGEVGREGLPAAPWTPGLLWEPAAPSPAARELSAGPSGWLRVLLRHSRGWPGACLPSPSLLIHKWVTGVCRGPRPFSRRMKLPLRAVPLDKVRGDSCPDDALSGTCLVVAGSCPRPRLVGRQVWSVSGRRFLAPGL